MHRRRRRPHSVSHRLWCCRCAPHAGSLLSRPYSKEPNGHNFNKSNRFKSCICKPMRMWHSFGWSLRRSPIGRSQPQSQPQVLHAILRQTHQSQCPPHSTGPGSSMSASLSRRRSAETLRWRPSDAALRLLRLPSTSLVSNAHCHANSHTAHSGARPLTARGCSDALAWRLSAAAAVAQANSTLVSILSD